MKQFKHQPNIRDGRDPLEIFWAKVEKSTTCWLWIAAKDSLGYGCFRNQSLSHQLIRAHVFSYQLTYGKENSLGQIRHSCENRHCVNPEHLYLHPQPWLKFLEKGLK